MAGYLLLVGFGRACAHPSFWAYCHAKPGAARPPAPPSTILLLVHPPKIKNKLIQKQNASLQARTRAVREFIFPLDHRGFDI